jgi:hypothetical protein
MLLLVLLFRFTDLGLKMRASAFNQEVARLLGVKVGRMLTLGWALAALVGSLSGLLIAGGGLVHPSYMDGVVVYGFVAAVLGGLDSPVGAVVGGLILGLSLSLVSGYVGSELVPLASLPRRAVLPGHRAEGLTWLHTPAPGQRMGRGRPPGPGFRGPWTASCRRSQAPRCGGISRWPDSALWWWSWCWRAPVRSATPSSGRWRTSRSRRAA